MRYSVVRMHLALGVLFFVCEAAPAENEYGIANDLVEEAKDAFEDAEKNENGEITMKGLADALHLLWSVHLDDDVIRTKLENWDKDGKGALNVDEYLRMLASHAKEAIDEENLKKKFKSFDKNDDNYLTREEFQVAVENQYGRKISKAEMDIEMNRFDHDHDGRISFNDFKTQMTQMALCSDEN